MTEFERMIQFLDLAWIRKDQIVPCLIGPVGIGKTAAVRQHAINVGAKNVVTIIASQILPSEVSGITMPDASSKSMEIYDHYKLSSLEDGDILFFDELLEADQCVLSACLTLIESRMMMSGKMLPDIQIIAATNPTVSPANIKENIRQRFMFMNFNIDSYSVADYIEEHAGFRPSNNILNKLQPTNNNSFNILSPRTLTKLCEWISSVGGDEDKLEQVSLIINKMFDSSYGTELVENYINRDIASPIEQVREAMKQAFIDNASTEEIDKLIHSKSVKIIVDRKEFIDEFFKSQPISELEEALMNLEAWNSIKEQLSNMQIEEKE